MNTVFKTFMIPLTVLLCIVSCGKARTTIIPPGSEVNDATVFEFKQNDGVWKMYKNSQEFFVKGAAVCANMEGMLSGPTVLLRKPLRQFLERHIGMDYM